MTADNLYSLARVRHGWGDLAGWPLYERALASIRKGARCRAGGIALFRVKVPKWYAFDHDHVQMLGPFNTGEECVEAIKKTMTSYVRPEWAWVDLSQWQVVRSCGLTTESKTRIKTNFIADEPYQDVGTVWLNSEALRPPSALCPRPFLAGLIDSAEPTDRQRY